MSLNLEFLNEELSSILYALQQNNTILGNTANAVCGEEPLSNKCESGDVPTPAPNGLIEELFRKINTLKGEVTINLNKIERINRSVYSRIDEAPNCVGGR